MTTPAGRLRELAVEMLKRHGSPEKALDAFLAAVAAGAELVVELVGQPHVRGAALGYLRRNADENETPRRASPRPPGGGSQATSESHGRRVPTPGEPTSGSQIPGESHTASDPARGGEKSPPTDTGTTAVSHYVRESQVAYDHGGGTAGRGSPLPGNPKKPVPTSKISKTAARAVALSAFDRRLEFGITPRTATWDDWVNLGLKSRTYADFSQRVLGRGRWSNDSAVRSRQRTQDVLDEQEYEAIWDEIHLEHDAMRKANAAH